MRKTIGWCLEFVIVLSTAQILTGLLLTLTTLGFTITTTARSGTTVFNSSFIKSNISGTASGNRGQIPPIPVNGVVGVLVDHVSSKISFYLNGTLVGTPFTSVPNTELFGFVTCHNLTVVTVNDPPKYTPY